MNTETTLAPALKANVIGTITTISNLQFFNSVALSLCGISKTAPYFHNNSAEPLEAVLDHYVAFFASVARLNPPPNLPGILSSNGLVVDRGFLTADERPTLLAYLRKL